MLRQVHFTRHKKKKARVCITAVPCRSSLTLKDNIISLPFLSLRKHLQDVGQVFAIADLFKLVQVLKMLIYGVESVKG